jgi:hypothetical protein
LELKVNGRRALRLEPTVNDADHNANALHEGAFVWADSQLDNFSSTGPNQFCIRASGGVGIGTGSPQAKLHVHDPGSFTPIYLSTGSGSEGPATFRLQADSGLAGQGRSFVVYDEVAAQFRMVINGSGNVGIGTASPSYKLHVNGSVAGVGAYNNVSDARFKTNINCLTNALEKVLRLRGVTYRWRQAEHPEKNFEPEPQVGLVAQEVKEVLPEVVSQDAEGYYSIAYSKVIPVLVEAIKDQQRQIEKGQESAREKEARIAALEARFAALERAMASFTEKAGSPLHTAAGGPAEGQ